MNHKKTARLERFSENCSVCGGYGIITRYYGGGAFTSEIDCNQCNGTGEVGNCAMCKGTGILKEEGSASEIKCSTCHGVGAVGDCADCAGTGMVSSEKGSNSEAEDEHECSKCDGFGYQQ